MSNISIRKALASDQAFLDEMLVTSLYAPEGLEPFTNDVLLNPDIARYTRAWGRASDIGFIAFDNQTAVGAVWLRLFTELQKGYGFVDAEIPELGVALRPDYRGQGVGTLLLGTLLDAAKTEYEAVSLSVSKGNAALGLYERLGFVSVAESKDAFTLLKTLSPASVA